MCQTTVPSGHPWPPPAGTLQGMREATFAVRLRVYGFGV